MVKQCIWGISCPERPVGRLHLHCFHVNVMQNGLSLNTWGILIRIWFACLFHYTYILTILPTRLVICFSFYMPHGFSSLFRCLLNLKHVYECSWNTCRVQNAHRLNVFGWLAFKTHGLSLHLVAVQGTAPQPTVTYTALSPHPTPIISLEWNVWL